MKLLKVCLLILLCSFTFWACSSEDDGNTEVEGNPMLENFLNFPYDKLSDYGIYEGNMSDLTLSEHLLPYELNSALFSNYSLKARAVYLPDGTSANYIEDATFDFPVGTVIVKTFYYLADFRDENSEKNIIETRLLVNLGAEWEAHSYIWNEDQTDADFAIVGKQFNVSWIHYDGSTRNANYQIPNKIECQDCHSLDGEIVPIGPKARNLNGLLAYKNGEMNQLDKWVESGWLSGLPSERPYMPKFDDETTGNLNDRARAYLDINCGHCHYPGAPADNSGLFLNFSNVDSLHLGICKPAVAAGGGSGGYKYDIVPGNPDESIMMFRMKTLELDEMMPESGRSVVHEEGVALIEAWIKSIQADDCE